MNSKYFLSANSFSRDGFAVVKNFIDKEFAFFLYNFIKIKANAISYKLEVAPEYYKNEWDGEFTDPQAPGVYGCYGDPVMDTLLTSKLLEMNKYVGRNLIPTYSYYRLYQKGSDLKRHRDRKSCDVSGTLFLGQDSTNLNHPYSWPIYIENKQDEEVPIYLTPGDILLYRGCDLDHWRNTFYGLNHAQVFLHYNYEEDMSSFFDGRQQLGFNTQIYNK